MHTRLVAVVIDCADPDALATFWSAALGYTAARDWTDAHGTRYVELASADPAAPMLLFQPVGDIKHGKNRVHLDIAPHGVTQAEEVARLLDLGARLDHDPHDLPWVVLTDPEGNEFCVLPPRD